MLDWSRIEKYYDLGNTAGFVLSMLESEKLLQQILREKKIPGKDVDEQLEIARPHISSPQTLSAARSIIKQLLDLELPKQIPQESAEQILKTYYTAINQLSQAENSAIRKQRWQYFYKNAKSRLGQAIIYLVITVIFITLISAFLTDTKLGQDTAFVITKVSRLLLYRALPFTLGLLIILSILMGFSLHRRKKSNAQIR